MAIPSRQIGWGTQENLIWGLQAQLNKLGRTMSQCCGSSSGCISFTDITWEAFIAAVDAGTIADCYYNITNRPNSGTDPLYVLVEKGLPNFDNEVQRSEQATSALCITSDQGVGCFNVYAETETLSFDYIENAVVYPITLKDCSIFAEGDIVTFTSAAAPFPTYTGVIHYQYNTFKECPAFLQITGGTGPIPPSPLRPDGTFSNGVDSTSGYIDARGVNKCIPFPTLSVGDVISGYLSPEGGVATATITGISGTTVTIAPTSGDWTGISVFYLEANKGCLFVTTAPITTTSILLTPDPVCFDFDNLLGQGVYLNTLMQATDGLIYGTLQSHPEYDGQLFSMDPVTEQVKILFTFDDEVTYGSSPSSGLVEIAGELYGTCNGGGGNGFGTIWKWNIATDTFTVLYSMNGPTEGGNPAGTLLYVGGKLYGTCNIGGANGYGTLFEFDPIALTYTVLLQMGDNEAIRYPQGPLKEVIPGELWGTSFNGGINDAGTVFKYTLISGVDEIVVNLNDVGASSATGGVMLASDGNVYFNTVLGGVDNNGTLSVITNISTTPVLNIVYSFDVNYGEGGAVCPVEIAGNLYGCTNYVKKGVTQPCTPLVGSIYKYDISVDIFTTLYTFDAPVDGGRPYLGQLLPIGDVLYGMTNEVSVFGQKICPEFTQPGQIFKYNITTETYTNVQPLGVPVSSPAEVTTSICESIVDPGYTCTTVGGCLFVSGTQFGNEAGQTLVVRTIVTFEGDLQGCTAPVPGDILYDNTTGNLIGTVLSFTAGLPYTMEVELNDNANPGYTSLPTGVYIQGDGCVFNAEGVTGTILDYTVQPFSGGKEPVNRPCYYNATYDVITDYPLSQPHTKAEIDYLVNNNLLVPGAFYHIMDVDKFLYGGTEIVIQANSVHTFNDTAMGLFYNPKYDQSVEGFGIYDGTATYTQGDTAIWGGLVITYTGNGSIGNASAYNQPYDIWTFPGKFKVFLDNASVFTAGEIVYDPNNSNLSMLVTEVGDNYIIVSCPPLFLAFATQLDNGSSTASIDSIELHEAFYSDLIYNAVWDEITYDYANDFISSRKDNAGNVVEQTWNKYKVANGNPIWRAIAGFQWGNEYAYNGDIGDTVGMYGNKITEGYVEVINFTLLIFRNNTFENSGFYDNSFTIAPGVIFDNVFQNDSQIYNNTFQGSSFNRNIFNTSYLSDSNVDVTFSNNVLNNSEVYNFNQGFPFQNNALKNSQLDLSTQAGDIERANFDYVNLTDNISGATRIYETYYSKDIVTGRDGLRYIKYVNNSGTLTVTVVTT